MQIANIKRNLGFIFNAAKIYSFSCRFILTNDFLASNTLYVVLSVQNKTVNYSLEYNIWFPFIVFFLYNFRIYKFNPFLVVSFRIVQATCPKAPRLMTNIRGLHQRLAFAGTEPATRHAQWAWRGDLNHWATRVLKIYGYRENVT